MGETQVRTEISKNVEVNEDALSFTRFSPSNTPSDKAAVTFWKKGLVCFNQKATEALALYPEKYKDLSVLLYIDDTTENKKIGFMIRTNEINSAFKMNGTTGFPVFKRHQYKEDAVFISIGSFRREHKIDLKREDGWFPLKYNTHACIHYVEIPSVIYNKDQ